MGSHSEQISNMTTESSHIGSSLTVDPENTHVSLLIVLDKFTLVDGSHSQFLLDGRDEWRSLEARSSQSLEGSLQLLDIVETAMELDYSDVLFTGALLGFDESGCVVDANNKASCDLWIQGTRVASFLNLEDLLDPCHNLVRRWVGWLVQVDHSIALVDIDWSCSW